MRIRAKDGQLAVQAVAGTDVVMLGMDLDPAVATDLLGFAIRRTDHTEGQRYWLRNQLGFRISGTRSSYSSWDNPIQTFRWGDYTAKPGHDYTYEVRALGGTAAQLAPVAVQTVRVRTDDGGHRSARGGVQPRGRSPASTTRSASATSSPTRSPTAPPTAGSPPVSPRP